VSGPWIAVIDDDASVRRGLARLLSSAGVRTREFESATDFLAHGLATQPACLVLDIEMGDMGGFGLLHCLHAEGRRIPTVLVSAHCESEVREHAGEYAATYLQKPFDPSVLVQVVSRVLHRQPPATDEHSTGTPVARSRIALHQE
jgi:FixJ family two-component response regulator